VRLRELFTNSFKFFSNIISIPSGAIKSAKNYYEKNMHEKTISIPSGAIKRERMQSILWINIYFNSFWCD